MSSCIYGRFRSLGLCLVSTKQKQQNTRDISMDSFFLFLQTTNLDQPSFDQFTPNLAHLVRMLGLSFQETKIPMPRKINKTIFLNLLLDFLLLQINQNYSGGCIAMCVVRGWAAAVSRWFLADQPGAS